MRFTRTIAVVTLSLSLTTVVGCGSSSSSKNASAGSKTSNAANSGSGGSDTGGSMTDACTTLTAEAVGSVLGGDVTKEAIPGGGCNFNQDDPRKPSASFATTPLIEGNGGFDGAKSGATSVIKGKGADVSGIGEKAFVVVGSAMGSSKETGSGLVQVGGGITQVTLIQYGELDTATIKDKTTELLKLAAGGS